MSAVLRISTQSSRAEYSNAIRPVTVGQAVQAERSTSNSSVFYISGAACGKVRLVAVMRELDVESQKFYLEDGTRGRIKCSPSLDTLSDGQQERITTSMSQRYVRVTGAIKQFNRFNFLVFTNVEVVRDPHEIYFHLSDVMLTEVVLEKGSPSPSVSSALSGARTNQPMLTGIFGESEWDHFDETTNDNSMTIIHQVPSIYASPRRPISHSVQSRVTLRSPSQRTQPGPSQKTQTQAISPNTPSRHTGTAARNDNNSQGGNTITFSDGTSISYIPGTQALLNPPKRILWDDFLRTKPPLPYRISSRSEPALEPSPRLAQGPSFHRPPDHDSPSPDSSVDDELQELLRSSEPFQPVETTTAEVAQEASSEALPQATPPEPSSSVGDYQSFSPSPVSSASEEPPPNFPSNHNPLHEHRTRDDNRAQLGFGDPSESISGWLAQNRTRRLSRDPYDNLSLLQRDIINTIFNARDDAGISSHLYPTLLGRSQGEEEWEGVPAGRLVEVLQRHSSPSVPHSQRVQQFTAALEDLLAKNYIRTVHDETHFTVVEGRER